MKTFDHAESACPHCGRETCASTGESEPPKAGQIAVCIECAGVNIYADGEGRLRLPTPQEMWSLRADPRVWVQILQYQTAIGIAKRSPHGNESTQGRLP